MFRKILNTAGARILVTLITFAIVVVNARQLGTQGVGTIGIVVLGITLLQLVGNLVGSNALVYLAPRYELHMMLIPSYCWATAVSVAGSFLLVVFDLIPSQYLFHVMVLSILQSLGTINMTVLLGKENIYAYNFITLVQFIIQITCQLLLFFVWKHVTVTAYLYALGAAYFFLAIGSFTVIKPFVHRAPMKGIREVLRQLLRFGSFVQTAAIIQLLNYRLSYYILRDYAGIGKLGIYTIGVQVSEGLWIVSRSMALVLYSRISNLSDAVYSCEVTLKFFRAATIAVVLMIIPVLLLPDIFFTFVFGKDFGQARMVILFMSPGIIAMAAHTMLSHYFSGTGRHYHNTIGSAIGLIFTLAGGFMLIPRYGLGGAAVTASLSYIASMLYQVSVFKYLNKTPLISFLPLRKEDYTYVFRELRGMMG